jgi:membrane protease YdiL (CAAX protease family)
MRGVGLARISVFYLALVAAGLAGLYARGSLTTLAPHSLAGWGLAAGVGVVCGLVLVGASRLTVARFGWARRVADELGAMVGELGLREIVVVAALSALGEELVFRGVLQPILGLGLTSVVFGSLHLGLTRRATAAWALMATVAGLILGSLYLWTGNLVAPVLAHGVVNFLNLRFLSPADRGSFVTVGPGGDEGTVA